MFILGQHDAGLSPLNEIEREWAYLSFLACGVVLSPTLPGEDTHPSQQSYLSAEERIEKIKQILNNGMALLNRYWDGKPLKGRRITSTVVPCGEEPGPHFDSNILEVFKTLAPTFIRRVEKIAKSDKLPEEMKPALIELAKLYKLLVPHMDRRHHLCVFMKCQRKDCAHCSANPISKDVLDTFYKMMKQHGVFFDAIPDPNRKGHHMRFEDVVRSEKNLNCLENGLKLPSKEKKAEERVKKQQEKKANIKTLNKNTK